MFMLICYRFWYLYYCCSNIVNSIQHRHQRLFVIIKISASIELLLSFSNSTLKILSVVLFITNSGVVVRLMFSTQTDL